MSSWKASQRFRVFHGLLEGFSPFECFRDVLEGLPAFEVFKRNTISIDKT